MRMFLKIALVIFVLLVAFAGAYQEARYPDPCAPGSMLRMERC